MKKLMLDLDALVVETFSTHRVEGAGTVRAHAEFEAVQQPGVIKTYPNCSEIDGCPSAWGGCVPTQEASCNGTCYNTCACPDSALSNCFNTGCGGCSGPICVAA